SWWSTPAIRLALRPLRSPCHRRGSRRTARAMDMGSTASRRPTSTACTARRSASCGSSCAMGSWRIRQAARPSCWTELPLFARAAVAEHLLRDAAHLDLLGAFGDAVAAVVAVDVLERHVARVADAAVHLHGAVCGVADEAVGAIVAHG